jgi:MFS superfamily sulfate permease-like transporter
VLAALALLTALFLTPLFYYLPNAALAAIVISAVLGFVRPAELVRIRAMRHDNFRFALLAMAGVLLLGMLAGLVLAVAMSILVLLSQVSRPSIALSGRRGGEVDLIDSTDRPDVTTLPGLAVIRPNASLLFINARWIQGHVIDVARQPSEPPLRAVVLDLSMTHDRDVEGVDTLTELRATLRAQGLDFWLASVRAAARGRLISGDFFAAEPAAGPGDLDPAVLAMLP